MKSQRQAKILEIITLQDVHTQEQLLETLQNAGILCTQATVSRDIKELRIVKELTQSGTYRYVMPVQEVSSGFSSRLYSIFRECVIRFDYAQNVVVIHTLPGLASAAASAVDAMKMESVLGTVGGTDTVMIILRDTESAAAFCGELSEILK